MIYLVRTTSFIKWDDSLDGTMKNLVAHLKKNYPQIKETKFLWNVTGPINEMHWVLAFDSLAAEDDWAGKVIRDEVYGNFFKETEGYTTPMIDRLYREMPEM